MDVITFIIFGFIIYSIFTGFQKTNQNRPRRGNTPWSQIPRIPPVSRELFEPITRPSFEERQEEVERPGSMSSDSRKAEELTSAEGREGEWGDEGRPDTIGTFSSEGINDYQSFDPRGKTKAKEQVVKPQGQKFKDQNVSKMPEDRINQDLTQWNENDLIRGVVWAEVLSSPRALHKFRGPRG